MKITIDNRDFENVHIDTYQMFTGESAEEYERENMRQDGFKDWETVEIDYDMPAVRDALAHESINYLTQETAHDGIIKAIKFIKSDSPRFYNYTTDWYIAEYEVNTPKLNDYIAAHYNEVLEKANGYSSPMSDENLAHAGLCHYIDNTITADNYNMAMWEKESECYYENQVINAIV